MDTGASHFKLQSPILIAYIMSASREHACVLPIPEFLVIRVDYDPLRSSAINLGGVV